MKNLRSEGLTCLLLTFCISLLFPVVSQRRLFILPRSLLRSHPSSCSLTFPHCQRLSRLISSPGPFPQFSHLSVQHKARRRRPSNHHTAASVPATGRRQDRRPLTPSQLLSHHMSHNPLLSACSRDRGGQAVKTAENKSGSLSLCLEKRAGEEIWK